MLHGSCLCGDVVFEIDQPPEMASSCHCGMCRKFHGTGFASYAMVPDHSFRITRGGEGIRRYASSEATARAFCGRCGSATPASFMPGMIGIPLGNVDGDPGVKPAAHIFVASKAPWDEITDDLMRFDEFPGGFEAPQVSPRPHPDVPAGCIAGSCLCGGVAYAIEGKIETIWNCHCQRCRKARSAAHATNGFVEVERFRFLRGESLLESYKVPEAARFRQNFCRTCGSILPRPTEGLPTLAIPLGSLDDDPGGRPSGHIFVGSKAPWFDITGPLPRHVEYPS